MVGTQDFVYYVHVRHKLFQLNYVPNLFFFFFFFLIFLRQGFSVALETVLELALVDQAGLEFTENRLPLPP